MPLTPCLSVAPPSNARKLQHGQIQYLAGTHVGRHKPLRGDVSPSRLLGRAEGHILDADAAALSGTQPRKTLSTSAVKNLAGDLAC